MKIYQVFESYPLFYQPYLPPVMEALKVKEGLCSTVVSFKKKASENSKDVIVLPNYKTRKLKARLFGLLNKKYKKLDYFEIKTLKDKVDIIHVQHSYLFSKVIRLLQMSKKNRPKIIITLRGGDTYVKPWVNIKWRNFYKDFGSKVDAFVVMSEDQKQYLSVKWGVPLENIHVIPISFGNKFNIEPNGPNTSKLKIFSVFRMCWEKNIVENLRFVKALKYKNIPIVYDVYGDGPDLAQLYYLRDKYGLNDAVNILGKVSNVELKNILSSYDFILQLSHSESLGMTVIEAQSHGVPAIVSCSGGLPEIIQKGKNGVVVTSENFEMSVQEVIHLWNSKPEYLTMSDNAIRHVQDKYAIENEVDKLTNLYFQIK